MQEHYRFYDVNKNEQREIFITATFTIFKKILFIMKSEKMWRNDAIFCSFLNEK